MVDGKNADQEYAVVIMPDASLTWIVKKKEKPVECVLMGININFSNAVIESDTQIMVVNFKLLTAEYSKHRTASERTP